MEIISGTELYHATSDKSAIEILRSGAIYPSWDSLDDEENTEPFISTTTNKSLRLHGHWPGSAGVTLVFDPDQLKHQGYTLKEFPKRWSEVRIYNLKNDSLPIQTIKKIIIHKDAQRHFKGFGSNLDFDIDPNAEKTFAKLKQNELSPKGEFVGSSNPYGIIKMLAQRNNIPVVDERQ